MTLGVLRVSALALSAAAFVLASPVPAANAATVAHHYGDAAHPRVSHGLHGYVARGKQAIGMSRVATQAIATTFGETATATPTTATIRERPSRPE